MGRKIVGAYVSLNCVAVLFEVIAASMTWHSTRFMVGPATIFRMKTGLLTASIDEGASLLCKFAPKKYCESLEDGFDLKEAAQQWCATFIVNVAAGPCHAFSTAFYMGLFVATTLLLNIIVLGLSCWLVYRYAAEEKHKPVYRQTAIILHTIATIAMVIVIILYFVLAGQQLDSIMPGLLLASGHGTGYGQIMFLVATLVQVAAAAVSSCVPMSNEQTEEEYLVDKMKKEKMRQYGGAKGFSTQDGPMDAERGYNQAFSNQQASFPPAQQAGYAPAQSPQPLAPQPSYMAPQAVPGPVMITAPASYTGPAYYTGAAAF